MNTSKGRVLFFVTGSIAGFKAAQVVSRLVQDGCEVQVVASSSALKFVGAATFEGLTGQRVLCDLWEDGRAMDHIRLSRWADFGVVCPASANIIGKMANGLADDVVSTTLLAWPRGKRLHVFPAMNSEMMAAEPVQKNLVSLRERGIIVAESGSGNLACGEMGEGRLLEPDKILEILKKELFVRTAGTDTSRCRNGIEMRQVATITPSGRRKILITGGATRESIDGIRFISNVSTGRTAAELCDRFSTAGWSVTYVHGPQAKMPSENTIHTLEFTDIASLDRILRAQLGREEFDAVIHCAAVSDFTVDKIDGREVSAEQKITSGEKMTLTLKPTNKILPNLKEYSRNKNIRVVGFKLTLNARCEEQFAAAEKIFDRSGSPGTVDAVVANDWSMLGQDKTGGGQGSSVRSREKHPGFILAPNERKEFETVAQMAAHLNEIFTKDLV